MFDNIDICITVCRQRIHYGVTLDEVMNDDVFIRRFGGKDVVYLAYKAAEMLVVDDNKRIRKI